MTHPLDYLTSRYALQALLVVLLVIMLPRFIALAIMVRAKTLRAFGPVMFCTFGMTLVAIIVLIGTLALNISDQVVLALTYISVDTILELVIPLYFLPSVSLVRKIIWTLAACIISGVIIMKGIGVFE